ncbi:MAG TPA: hypothetical protein VE888_17245 [Streptosporangiaceae bacterium]|nr:hypothetical protein [Streptosporangiaceae bacterium]
MPEISRAEPPFWHQVRVSRYTVDLVQTRLNDISQTWEHLKAGPPRKLVVKS